MKTAWTDQIKLEGLVFFSHVGVLPEKSKTAGIRDRCYVLLPPPGCDRHGSSGPDD